MIEEEIKKISIDYTKNIINGKIVFFVTIKNKENSFLIAMVSKKPHINIKWYIGTLKIGYINHVKNLIDEYNMNESNIKFKIVNR
jgi:hypothetical protein